VRSYWWWDTVIVIGGANEIDSVYGRINFMQGPWVGSETWKVSSDPIDADNIADYLAVQRTEHENLFGFSFIQTESTFVSVPHWFTVSILGVFAAAPWLRWRFSLRMLLIGMTVIAILMGLVLWASRGR
jgi:hypothetical protein